MSNPPLFILGSFVAACSAKTERLPVAGESLQASSFIMEAGGKGFNVAVGARRLGANVDGIFAVGNDFLSGLAEPAFRRAALSPDMLVRYPGSTGAGIGFIDPDGENCLAIFPGANAKLSAEDVTAALRKRRAGHVLAQFEIGDAPIIRAFTIARETGATTILNPSPYRSISPEILSRTAILVVNRIEAVRLGADLGLQLTSEADLAVFARIGECLVRHGPDILIVTLGSAGVVAFQKNAPPIRVPAFAVAAVDTLGAGDAFLAAFAASRATHRSLSACLRSGAAAGACVASRPGVFEALPTSGELEAMLGAATL